MVGYANVELGIAWTDVLSSVLCKLKPILITPLQVCTAVEHTLV